MAAGDGTREVPDSEDEPMTSSPVNVADGAGNKLSATAPVPLQDAQDALQEAARPHQATAEHNANPNDGRTDGLGADREIASVDVDATLNDRINLQPCTSTPQQHHVGQPSRDQANSPASDISLESELVANTRASSQDAPAMKQGQQEADHEVTAKPDFKSTSKTDNTAREPGIGTHDALMLAKEQTCLMSQESALHINERESPMGTRNEAQNINEAGHVWSESERIMIDSENGVGSGLNAEHEGPPTNFDVSQKAQVTPAHLQGEKLSGPESHAWNEGLVVTEGHGGPDAEAVPHDVSQAHVDKLANIPQELSPDMHNSTTADAVVLSNVQDLLAEGRSIGRNVTAPQPSKSTFCDNTMIGSPITASAETGHQLHARNRPEPGIAGTRGNLESSTEQASTTRSSSITPSPIDVELEAANLEIATEDDVARSILETEKPTVRSNVSKHTPANAWIASTPGYATSEDMHPVQKNSIPDAGSSATNVESNSNSQPTTSDQASQILVGTTIAKTTQEITLAELKAQKAGLLASLAALPAIQVLIEENASSNAETSDGDDEPTETDIMAAANKIVKDHIKLLHEYNELKDVGQGLMGLIADQRGIRIVEVQEEFGIDAKD